MHGKNIPHDAARGHVTGESIFIDDRPLHRGELWVDVVTSPVAHGHLRGVDTEAALRVPGVVAAFTHHDLHHNVWGTIIQDQPLLAADKVMYVGEPIVVLAAESRAALKAAKKQVLLDIEVLPPILTIDEARAAESFIAIPRFIRRGDVAKALATSPHTLRGTFENAGQDHFYLESHACVVYPGEHGYLEIHSSSQHPTEVQHLVAEALGLPQNKVACIVKRMGGGFGGKESQAAPFAAFAGLVAQKLQRPARLILSKDDDMGSTGKRHPFKSWYEVGFDDSGRITGLKVDLFSDGGAYADLSTSVMERAMLHSDNAYYLENADINGRICRTHTPPNTAFRGFGGPQGVAMIESIIESIAITLGKDALEVRKVNLYQGDRNTAPYGQTIENNTLPELLSDLSTSAGYRERRALVDQFNRTSATHLKGLALTPVKFGISFTTRFLNQGSAVVNIHQDGTLQVSTGATEMGQGVNTKISQIVAEAFGLTPAEVVVLATSTERNHNTSPTAASSGTDINGSAALMACNHLKKRLAAAFLAHYAQSERGAFDELIIDFAAPTDHVVFADGHVYDSQAPERRMAFPALVKMAYLNRVSLGDYAFYKTPEIHFNKDTGQGHPFQYYTNGVALSEVLIDRFTGELKVLDVDILMDLGRSINPGIDHGQVSGAFIQGMGWVTCEKLVYNDQGVLLSHSPTTYKIPNIQDVPRNFNIRLLDNPHNTGNVRGSKAVGEPPLLLGLSVWAAIKNALAYVNPTQAQQLKLPATAEDILMHLSDVPAPAQV